MEPRFLNFVNPGQAGNYTFTLAGSDGTNTASTSINVVVNAIPLGR